MGLIIVSVDVLYKKLQIQKFKVKHFYLVS